MSIVWRTVLVLYVVSTNEVALGCYVFPKGKWTVYSVENQIYILWGSLSLFYYL